MKTKKLTKILIVLIILALALISFAGIYVKRNNILPDYNISMSLKGARNVKLVPDDSSEEVTYDPEGNETTEGTNEDGTLKEGYTKELKYANTQEVLNEENYEQAKKILQKRFEKLGLQEYTIAANYDNGEISIQIPEGSDADTIISYLTYKGEFTIQDSETEEVLINNDDIKDCKVLYSSSTSGLTVLVRIEFNKEGTQKLKDITNTYVATTSEDGTETEKTVTLKLDNETLIQTSFDEENSQGILQLTVGTASTTSEDINTYIQQGAGISSLISSGEMNVQYKLDENVYIQSYLQEKLPIIMITLIDVLAVILLAMYLVKGRKGAFASVSVIGFIALLLIVLRYTNVVISIESIVSFIIVTIADIILLNYVINEINKNEKSINAIWGDTYKKYAKIYAPLAIISIVFTFIKSTQIASIGMVMFWGLLVLAVYNVLITKVLLADVKEKSKKD